MHCKYRSHTNGYNVVPHFMNQDQLVAVTEKIDGSNFSIIAHNGELQYASRNQIVDPVWHNLQELIPDELKVALLEKSNTKVRTIKSLSEQQVQFMAYVNESRMLSYISKVGEPKSMSDMGPYIKGILDDAYAEYTSTLTPEELMTAHKDRALMKVGSKLIVPLLKARIQNALYK